MAVSPATPQRLLDLITRLRAAMTATPALAKHFHLKVAWLDDRANQWQKREWRVALIGVTSSGKSTLMNAMLGESVLPVRIRPSSNALVICTHGKQKEAVVHFESGRTETLSGDGWGERLCQFSDERFNEGNRKGVKEIELRSPCFRLADHVALVDTPGLDAKDLEHHEKVTLEFFLPTVDLVLFLTTAKVNADAQISYYLDRVQEQRKPFILAQNMVQSIEPAVGANGVVLTSKEEMTARHRARLEKLLNGRRSTDGPAIPLLQIDALSALAGRPRESNLDQLVLTVQDELARLEPAMGRARFDQVIRELESVLATAPSEEPGKFKPVGNPKEQEKLEAIGRSLAGCRAELEDKLSSFAEGARERSMAFREPQPPLYPSQTQRADELEHCYLDWCENNAKTLSALIAAFQRDSIQPILKELNISEEDIAFESRRHGTIYKKPNYSYQETITEKREGKGFIPWVKRIFGDYGYKYVNVTINKIDVDGLLNWLHQRAYSELSWIHEASNKFKTQFELYERKIQKVIDEKRSFLQSQNLEDAQKRETLKAYSELRSLLAELRSLVLDLPKGGQGDSATPPAIPSSDRPLELSRLLLDLTHYANLSSRKTFLDLRTDLLKRIEPRGKGQDRRVFIWGFDPDSMERFLLRFWCDCLSGRPEPGPSLAVVTQTGGFASIGVGIEVPDKDPGPALRKESKAFLEQGPPVVFVLVDVLQIGATLTHWHRSVLPALLPAGVPVVLVLDSVLGLRQARGMAEGFLELRRYLGRGLPRPAGVLVNDEKPVLSRMADALFTGEQRLGTHADEQAFLQRLVAQGEDPDPDVVAVIRGWRACKDE
jgi:hypothetical protein